MPERGSCGQGIHTNTALQLEKQKLRDEIRRRLRVEKQFRRLLMAQPVRDKDVMVDMIEELRLGQAPDHFDEDQSPLTPLQNQFETSPIPNGSASSAHRTVLFDVNSTKAPVSARRLEFDQTKNRKSGGEQGTWSLVTVNDDGNQQQGNFQVIQQGDLVRNLKHEIFVSQESLQLIKADYSDLTERMNTTREKMQQLEAQNLQLTAENKQQSEDLKSTQSEKETLLESLSEEQNKTQKLNQLLLQEQYNVIHWQEEYDKLRKKFEELTLEFETFKVMHVEEQQKFMSNYEELRAMMQQLHEQNVAQQEQIGKLVTEKEQVNQQSDSWHARFREQEGRNDVLEAQVVKWERQRKEAEEAAEKAVAQQQYLQEQIRLLVLQQEDQFKERQKQDEATKQLLDHKLDKKEVIQSAMKIWENVFYADLERMIFEQDVQNNLQHTNSQLNKLQQIEQQLLVSNQEIEVRKKLDEKLSTFKNQLQLVGKSCASNLQPDPVSKLKQTVQQMMELNEVCIQQFSEVVKKSELKDEESIDEKSHKQIYVLMLQKSDLILQQLLHQQQLLSEELKTVLEDSETRLEQYLVLNQNKTQLLKHLDSIEQMNSGVKLQTDILSQNHDTLWQQFEEYLESIKQHEQFQVEDRQIVQEEIESISQDEDNLSEKAKEIRNEVKALVKLRNDIDAAVGEIKQKLMNTEQQLQAKEKTKQYEDDDARIMLLQVQQMKVVSEEQQSLNEQLYNTQRKIFRLLPQVCNSSFDFGPGSGDSYWQGDGASIGYPQVKASLSDAQGKVILNLEVPEGYSNENIKGKLQESEYELNLIREDLKYISSSLKGEYESSNMEITNIKTDIFKQIALSIQQLISRNQQLEEVNKEMDETSDVLRREIGDMVDMGQQRKVWAGVNKLLELLHDQCQQLRSFMDQITVRDGHIDELYGYLNTLNVLNEQYHERLQERQSQLDEVRRLCEQKEGECELLRKVNGDLEGTCEQLAMLGHSLMNQLELANKVLIEVQNDDIGKQKEINDLKEQLQQSPTPTTTRGEMLFQSATPQQPVRVRPPSEDSNNLDILDQQKINDSAQSIQAQRVELGSSPLSVPEDVALSSFNLEEAPSYLQSYALEFNALQNEIQSDENISEESEDQSQTKKPKI